MMGEGGVNGTNNYVVVDENKGVSAASRRVENKGVCIAYVDECNCIMRKTDLR